MRFEFLEKGKKPGDICSLYESLGWKKFLDIDNFSLEKAMKNSLLVIYAYESDKLVGTGRIISDGIINAYICGIGVDPNYQNLGIGSEILSRLVTKCKKSKLHIQLICEEELVGYYNSKGFKKFAVAMKKD